MSGIKPERLERESSIYIVKTVNSIAARSKDNRPNQARDGRQG